jgi:hypothetical protein
LDCGYLPVSYWEDDGLGDTVERFCTIEVGLPFYFWPDLYYLLPGNVNFGPNSFLGDPPNNLYNFSCGGSLQLVSRGTMWPDTSSGFITLPLHFANIDATIDGSCRATINWSNLTESNINYYQVEKSDSAGTFQPLYNILPTSNNGGRADYSFTDTTVFTGYNLYRIKAVENSSNFFYSMVLRVNGCRGGRSANNIDSPRLRIYPNPSQNGRFFLNVNDLPAGRYDIVLVSALGQQRIITELDHNGGTVNKLFNLGWVPAGLYTLVLRSDNIQLIQKIIITD